MRLHIFILQQEPGNSSIWLFAYITYINFYINFFTSKGLKHAFVRQPLDSFLLLFIWQGQLSFHFLTFLQEA